MVIYIISVLSWWPVAMISDPVCLSCIGILRRRQLLMSGRLTKGLTVYIRPVFPWLLVAMFSTLRCLSCIGILSRSHLLISDREPD